MNNRFENVKKVGLRDKTTEKIVAMYPDKVEGTEEEIIKKVKDWFYNTSCAAEDMLKTLYVDALTDSEVRERD